MTSQTTSTKGMHSHHEGDDPLDTPDTDQSTETRLSSVVAAVQKFGCCNTVPTVDQLDLYSPTNQPPPLSPYSSPYQSLNMVGMILICVLGELPRQDAEMLAVKLISMSQNILYYISLKKHKTRER